MVDISGKQETTVATPSALQVRVKKRIDFQKKIEKKIMEYRYSDVLNFYRVFFFLLDKQLILSGDDPLDMNGFNEIYGTSYETKTEIFRFFCEVRMEIMNFQRSEKEGKDLFARLLEWTAKGIAIPYYFGLADELPLE